MGLFSKNCTADYIAVGNAIVKKANSVIQECNDEIVELRNENKDLKNKIKELEKKIAYNSLSPRIVYRKR